MQENAEEDGGSMLIRAEGGGRSFIQGGASFPLPPTPPQAETRWGNCTAISKTIRGGEAAPHSSLAHFRCVVAHEVRLLAGGGEGDRYTGGVGDEFFDALAEAINRYLGSTSQAGEIREYVGGAGGEGT